MPSLQKSILGSTTTAYSHRDADGERLSGCAHGRQLVSRGQRRTSMFPQSRRRLISATRNQVRTDLASVMGCTLRSTREPPPWQYTIFLADPQIQWRCREVDSGWFWLVRPRHPNGGNRSLSGRSFQSATTAGYARDCGKTREMRRPACCVFRHDG
jgi:hypothetical protein